MEKALNHVNGHVAAHGPSASAAARDWRKQMSNHVAWSLLAYTTLQIIANAILLKQGGGSSLLPYIALVVLVAAVIPGWRMLESRWTDLSDAEAADPALAAAFARDRTLIWVAAVGPPLVMTGFFKLVAGMVS